MVATVHDGDLMARRSGRFSTLVRRRTFLIESSRAALGFSLLPLAGCSTVTHRSRGPRDIFLESRIVEWERGIPQWLQDARLPGVSMLLIDGGKVFWQREFGVKDAVSKEPVDRDTVFAACSNTKPVFAYAVAKLCEKGVMDLDTPLTRYTSKRFLEGDQRLDLITARHVLAHTTGFPNWRNDQEPLAIQFTPGTKVQYSGEGFHYLQSVVEEVTRQPFAEFMRVNVLEPFGMMSSRFDWDETYARRIARPHDQNGKPMETKPKTASELAADLATYGAAASLHTTPADYARFILELIDPKPADAFRLNEDNRREYLRPQVKRDEITSRSLGWIVAQLNGPDRLQPCRGCSRMELRCESVGRPKISRRHHDEWRQFSAVLREAEVGSGILHALFCRVVIQVIYLLNREWPQGSYRGRVRRHRESGSIPAWSHQPSLVFKATVYSRHSLEPKRNIEPIEDSVKSRRPPHPVAQACPTSASSPTRVGHCATTVTRAEWTMRQEERVDPPDERRRQRVKQEQQEIDALHAPGASVHDTLTTPPCNRGRARFTRLIGRPRTDRTGGTCRSHPR